MYHVMVFRKRTKHNKNAQTMTNIWMTSTNIYIARGLNRQSLCQRVFILYILQESEKEFVANCGISTPYHRSLSLFVLNRRLRTSALHHLHYPVNHLWKLKRSCQVLSVLQRRKSHCSNIFIVSQSKPICLSVLDVIHHFLNPPAVDKRVVQYNGTYST